MVSREDKVKGAMIGGAIGDALGYPIEFQRDVFDREVKKYKNLSGKALISDDTQMTLFTANAILWRESNAILNNNNVSINRALYLAYKDWYDSQNLHNYRKEKICWIKDIQELNVQRAPGQTCLSALEEGVQGTIEQPLNDSKGCGAIMRIAPIALYYKDLNYCAEVAVESSVLTHGHILSQMTCFLGSIIINLLTNNDFDIKTSLKLALKQFKKYYKNSKEKKYLLDMISKAIKLSKKSFSDVYAIGLIGEGWVAEEALAIALYSCLKYSNSFENAIICAVNHKGDSDSTGAIAGNIMGAYLGIKNIPKYYKDNLELKEVIEELSEDLCVDISTLKGNNQNLNYWKSKYIDCKRDLTLK